MQARILLLFSVLILSGCSSSEEKALGEIKKKEEALYSEDSRNFKFDANKAREVIAAYEDFAKNHPHSKDAPEMLMKSADLHRSLKEYDAALSAYQKISTDFPAFDKQAQVLFLQGFVYENELYRVEQAREIYEKFLQLYPEHDLADDVKFSLMNLGKSPEEIIRGFEKQEEASNDSTPS